MVAPPPNSSPPQTTELPPTSGATFQTEKVFKKFVYVDKLGPLRCKELITYLVKINDFKDVMFIFSSLNYSPDVENLKSIKGEEYDAIVQNLSELENSYRICDKKQFKSLSDADQKMTVSDDKFGYTRRKWPKTLNKLIGGSD